MPFLESTEIQKAIAKAESGLGDAEFREGSNATSKLLFNNATSAFANLTSLKESLSQPTEAILQKRVSEATTANKTAVHTGNFGDSFVKPIAFVQTTRNFAVSYKLAENNQFGYQEQLSAGMTNAVMDIREQINAYGLANLAAVKTQVAEGATLLTWDGANFKYTNEAAKIEKAASNIKAAARKNKYGQSLDIIGGQQLVSDLVHNSAQGSSNDENLSYQFGGLSIAEEELLDEATLGAKGFGYIMPKGMVGMTSWNEPINRSGAGGVDQNRGLFTTIKDSVIQGLRYDVHVIRGVADNAVTSKTYYQDPTDQYQVTAIYTFSHSLISVANESPLFAFEQL